MQIKNVVVVGGTHGNEKTGVYVIRYLQSEWKNPFTTFTFRCLEGNPKAIQQNSRYVDYDLNRSVNSKEIPSSAYEKERAQALVEAIDDPNTFVIDLHTTTSNANLTWIFSKSDPLSRQIGYQAACENASSSYLLETAKLDDEANFVNNIAKHGLMIEVGPIAQNIVEPNIYNLTLKAVLALLAKIEDLNLGKLSTKNEIKDYYKEVGHVDFPRSADGELQAMIHPDLQNTDYNLLEKKAIFQTLAGESIYNDSLSDYYPMFINEAAYYEKKIAFMYAEKLPIERFWK